MALTLPQRPAGAQGKLRMLPAAIARMRTALNARLAVLCEEWRKMHGTP
jgi:hypothetical protein